MVWVALSLWVDQCLTTSMHVKVYAPVLKSVFELKDGQIIKDFCVRVIKP